MKKEPRKQLSLFDVYGEWENQGVTSGLIERVRKAWKKPFIELTNEELATLLRQKFAIEYVLPLARQRVIENCDDGSEMYDGELESIIKQFDEEDNQ